ncbi:hypothetical protein ES707_21723 [subsurface metagenome]
MLQPTKSYNLNMPAKVSMTKKELQDLIEAARAAGRDVTELEGFLAEVSLAEPLVRKRPAVPAAEAAKPSELVVSPQELERLRTLACPHIRDSPYWQDFVSRRVLVCSDCHKMRPGEFGELRQPPLL